MIGSQDLVFHEWHARSQALPLDWMLGEGRRFLSDNGDLYATRELVGLYVTLLAHFVKDDRPAASGIVLRVRRVKLSVQCGPPNRMAFQHGESYICRSEVGCFARSRYSRGCMDSGDS